MGAGPTGLTLAILLKQAGLSPVVFEKRTQLDSLPAAHVVNVRTCEIFREMSIFDAVAQAAAPPEKMQAVTWRESVSGKVYGALALHGDPESQGRRSVASPARAVNIGQDDVERIMADRLRALGGEILMGHEVSGATIRDGKPVLTFADGEQEFDYVIACDGVRSTVRQALGIQMEGPASLAEFIAIYFKADLSRHLDKTPGPVHFLAGADVRGSIIGFDLASIWALMCVVPSSDEAYARKDELGPELLRRAIDDPQIDFEILSVGTWNMSAQVAARFQEGPILLAGDAAHRFPPTGGLGLNTGVPDAHNIAWKLIAIARGWAGPALLDTYEAERRPIALHNCEHSVSNMKRMVLIDKELEAEVLTPIDLSLIDRAPSPRLSVGLDAGTPEAQAKQARVDAAIEDEREHFDSLRVELFYAYPGKAGEDLHPAQPKTGSRVPHAWLAAKGTAHSTLEAEGTAHSTLDLCRDAFALIVGPRAEGWAQGVAREAVLRGMPMRIWAFENLGGTADAWRASMGLDADGAVLVRPDGHIAWLSSSAPMPDATVMLDAIATKGVC